MYEPEGADNYLAELGAQIDAAYNEDMGARIIIVFDATSPVLAMRKFRRQCHRRRQGRYAGEWLETLMRLVDRLEVVVFMWQRSHMGSVVNEWADVEANTAAMEAARGEYVGVPRVCSRSYSMLFTGPRRSTHEWAVKAGHKVVESKLLESVRESAMHEECDVPVIKLPDDVRRTCDAILSARSLLGDDKLLVGRTRVRMVGRGSCPFGCADGRGERARFTWFHAQFECGQCELVDKRRIWLEAVEEAAEALLPGESRIPHTQANYVIDLLKQGLPRTREGRAPVRGALREMVVRMARRFAGGLVRGTGDAALDRSKVLHCSLRGAMIAGARVQQAAQALTRDAELLIREEAASLSRVKKFAQRWRRITCEAGPKRAAALREASMAVSLARRAICARAQSGELSAEEAESQMKELVTEGEVDRVVTDTVLARALTAIRETCRKVGGDAYLQWRIVAGYRRWRLRALLQSRGPHGRGDAGQGTRCGRVGTPPDREVPEARDMLAYVTGYTDRIYVPVAGARSPRDAIGDACITGVIELEQTAHARWELGGRWRGELRRRCARAKRARAMRNTHKEAETSRAAAGMRRYLGSFGGAPVGVSGKPLSPISGPISWEVATRRKRGRAAHTSGRPAESAARRRFLSGSAPDRWDKWRVDKVMEVRRPRSGTRGRGARGVEARIRWVGRDPVSGLPWADSWIPLQTVDEHGRARQMMSSMLTQEARTMEHRMFGTHPRCVRASATSVPVAARATYKWRNVLRGQLESAASPRPWWENNALSGSEDEEEERSGGRARRRLRAMRDLCRKRSRQYDGQEQARQRRRRVLHSSSGELEDDGRFLRLPGDCSGAGDVAGTGDETGEDEAMGLGAYVYPEWFHMQGGSSSE